MWILSKLISHTAIDSPGRTCPKGVVSPLQTALINTYMAQEEPWLGYAKHKSKYFSGEQYVIPRGFCCFSQSNPFQQLIFVNPFVDNLRPGWGFSKRILDNFQKMYPVREPF